MFYRMTKTTASGFEQAGVVRGGNACSPQGMTLAGLEPAIFGSDDHRFTHEATRPHVALRLARGRLEDFGEPSGALGRLAAPRVLAGT